MTRILLALTLLASTAAAQPKPRPTPSTTLAAATSYESCSKSWAFACGKPDGRGGTYGTAHEMTHCERYTLHPDGTFTSTGLGLGTRYGGTYRIVKNKVTFTTSNDDGTKHTYSLDLAADGSTLGGMKRL